MANIPETMANEPKTSNGKKLKYRLSNGTNGAKRAPNREKVLNVPTPPLRIKVGNISAKKNVKIFSFNVLILK